MSETIARGVGPAVPPHFEVVLRDPETTMFADPALEENHPERITLEELRAKMVVPEVLAEAGMDLLVLRGADGRLYQAAFVLDLVPFDPLERAREVGDVDVHRCALCEAAFVTPPGEPSSGEMARHLFFAHDMRPANRDTFDPADHYDQVEVRP